MQITTMFSGMDWAKLKPMQTEKKVQNWAFIRTKLWTTWQDTWYRRNVEQKRKYAGRRSQTARAEECTLKWMENQ